MILATAETTDPTLAEQIAPLLGSLSGVFALAGVWVGKRWERRSGTESWRRDRRLDAYTRFVKELATIDGAVLSVLSKRSRQERDNCMGQANEAFGRLDHIEAEIQLLGSAEVAQEAATTISVYLDSVDEAFRGALAAPEGRPVEGPRDIRRGNAQMVFIAVAKQALD